MNAKFHLEEVETSLSRKSFLELPVRLYKDEFNWIRPLDNDIEAVFDPEKNKMLSLDFEKFRR